MSSHLPPSCFFTTMFTRLGRGCAERFLSMPPISDVVTRITPVCMYYLSGYKHAFDSPFHTIAASLDLEKSPILK